MTQQAILISGCDSGFGKRLVEMLQSNKQFLIFAGVFTDQGKALYQGKSNVVAVPLDVTSDKSVAECLEFVKTELQVRNAKFYGLVNNAGVLTRPAPTEWQDVTNYERMMAVNCFGVVRLTNAFLPLIRQNQGRIVILASIAARNALGFNSAYCASKYAVGAYAELLRRDMLPWKVRVCVVEPGIFGQTGLYGDWVKGLDATWSSLNPEVKESYGTEYYKRTRGVLGYVVKGLSNGNPDEVPENIIDALTNPKPLRRYRPGRDSKGFFRVMPLLPDHVSDYILTRPLGKPNLPAKVTGITQMHDLYSNDMTSTAVLGGAVALSAVGVYTVGKNLLSRL